LFLFSFLFFSILFYFLIFSWKYAF
jgi:hypothetical protein